MKRVLVTILGLIAMISLLIERSSCFEILVVGLLLIIYVAIDNEPKLNG